MFYVIVYNHGVERSKRISDLTMMQPRNTFSQTLTHSLSLLFHTHRPQTDKLNASLSLFICVCATQKLERKKSKNRYQSKNWSCLLRTWRWWIGYLQFNMRKVWSLRRGKKREIVVQVAFWMIAHANIIIITIKNAKGAKKLIHCILVKRFGVRFLFFFGFSYHFVGM